MVESLKFMKAKKDRVQIIVESVMSEPIPEPGQLINPFKKQRKSSKQVTLDDMLNKRGPQELPENVEEWTGKNFATYFARSYQNTTGGNYKITFTSDLPIIKQIGDFIASNGLPRNQGTKTFIDWAMKNHDRITQKHNYFTLNSVFNSINHFHQEIILTGNDIDSPDTEGIALIESIKETEIAGNVTEIFAKFGIPITITYLTKIAGLDEDKIYAVLDKRLKTLSIGMNGNNLIMERIFKSSIMSSPYPKGFAALDWRERYNNFASTYYLEAWWRDEDYKGDPQEKYDVLLGGK
jgi:hypothetical protein